MATEALKILGQLDAAATTLTDLYTVPANKYAAISRVTCTNRNTSVVSVRVACALAGAANDVKQYLEYDTIIDSRQSLDLSGIVLAQTDVLRVYASATGVSFNAVGSESTWAALKILGQLDAAATTLTDLYTVTAGKSAVVSKLACCNRNAFPVLVRVAIAAAGAVDNAKQYIEYDRVIEANQTNDISAIALGATDVLRVYANATGVSFNALGSEE